MPSINLIASRREEKRRLEQYTRRLIYAIAGEVGLMIMVASVMVLRIMTVRGHIEQLDGQIGQLQPKVNQIQGLQDETAKLKPKVGTLNEARNNTLYWYTAIQTVVSSLPQQSWLNAINTTGDPGKGSAPAASSGSSPAPAGSAAGGATLTFTGMAASSDQVGLAMMKMNQFTNIASVTLNSVDQGNYQGQPTMSFSMVVQLKGNSAADAATPVGGTAGGLSGSGSGSAGTPTIGTGPARGVSTPATVVASATLAPPAMPPALPPAQSAGKPSVPTRAAAPPIPVKGANHA